VNRGRERVKNHQASHGRLVVCRGRAPPRGALAALSEGRLRERRVPVEPRRVLCIVRRPAPPRRVRALDPRPRVRGPVRRVRGQARRAGRVGGVGDQPIRRRHAGRTGARGRAVRRGVVRPDVQHLRVRARGARAHRVPGVRPRLGARRG
jgi:hypothetical protein